LTKASWVSISFRTYDHTSHGPKEKFGGKKKENKTTWDTNIRFQNKTFLAYEAFRGYIHLLAKSLRCEK
jgi:hypothetical protein